MRALHYNCARVSLNPVAAAVVASARAAGLSSATLEPLQSGVGALPEVASALEVLGFVVRHVVLPELPPPSRARFERLPWGTPHRLGALRRGLLALPWVRGHHLTRVLRPDGRFDGDAFAAWLRAQTPSVALRACEGALEALRARAGGPSPAEFIAQADEVGPHAPLRSSAAPPPGGFPGATFDGAARAVRRLYREAGFTVSRLELGHAGLGWAFERLGRSPLRFELRARLAHGRVTEVRAEGARTPEALAHQQRMLALLHGQLEATTPPPSAPRVPRAPGALDTRALLEKAAARLPVPQVVLACCTLAEAAVTEAFTLPRANDWGPCWAIATARAWAYGRAGPEEVSLAASAAEISSQEAAAAGLAAAAEAARAATFAARACFRQGSVLAELADATARARGASTGNAEAAQRLEDVELLRTLEQRLA
ncbi:MAG: hypothetical protein K1X89_04835 [Myxococcaceae bacterium]|nr:hypothetical protein [Myxococcaceae bacterium]